MWQMGKRGELFIPELRNNDGVSDPYYDGMCVGIERMGIKTCCL